MRPRILLTGKNGQVGKALCNSLPYLGEVTALDRRQLDLGKPDEIRRVIRAIRPDLIVNAAAYTAVDRAESEPELAEAINAVAPRILAEEALEIGAAVVHYSTDYIFDGTNNAPYREDDEARPRNVYGRTKLRGERALRQSGASHLVFRTAWVYAQEGRNFLLAVLRLATEREELRIVQDQVGSPTWSRAIGEATTSILSQIYTREDSKRHFRSISGTYHMTAGGQASWYDFGKAIIEESRDHVLVAPWFAAATGRRPLIAKRVIPIATSEYPTAAPRPPYSVLSNALLERTFSVQLPDWRAQLGSFFQDGAPE